MDVKSFMELLIDNLAGIVQCDESLTDPLFWQAAVDEMMEMSEEECVYHTYQAFLQGLINTNIGIE